MKTMSQNRKRSSQGRVGSLGIQTRLGFVKGSQNRKRSSQGLSEINKEFWRDLNSGYGHKTASSHHKVWAMVEFLYIVASESQNRKQSSQGLRYISYMAN